MLLRECTFDNEYACRNAASSCARLNIETAFIPSTGRPSLQESDAQHPAVLSTYQGIMVTRVTLSSRRYSA
jgi:hypothetical protein